MSRIKIDLPSSYVFSTEIIVRVTDLNYGGHVGHDRILSFMHEARVQYYRQLGYKDELNMEGIGQIIADAAITYKSESFLGDVLLIRIAIADISKYGFDMIYHITNKTSGGDVAIGKTGIVCFNYERRKIATIPSGLLHTLRA